MKCNYCLEHTEHWTRKTHSLRNGAPSEDGRATGSGRSLVRAKQRQQGGRRRPRPPTPPLSSNDPPSHHFRAISPSHIYALEWSIGKLVYLAARNSSGYSISYLCKCVWYSERVCVRVTPTRSGSNLIRKPYM